MGAAGDENQQEIQRLTEDASEKLQRRFLTTLFNAFGKNFGRDTPQGEYFGTQAQKYKHINPPGPINPNPIPIFSLLQDVDEEKDKFFSNFWR